jgi:hypothetical protein
MRSGHKLRCLLPLRLLPLRCEVKSKGAKSKAKGQSKAKVGGLSFLLVVTKIYLLLGFLPLILAILASIHITQVIILLIIKSFYGLYIIVFKKEKFEVRNLPLNR